MYFWKTQKLVDKIKEGNLTEKEQKNYYLATSIIGIAFLYMAVAGGTHDGIATLTECILLIFITILGINITFASNCGNEGVNYDSRLVMLSLPIIIKVVLISFIGGALVGVLVGVASDKNGELNMQYMQWGTIVISVLSQTFFLWRLNVHIRNINT